MYRAFAPAIDNVPASSDEALPIDLKPESSLMPVSQHTTLIDLLTIAHFRRNASGLLRSVVWTIRFGQHQATIPLLKRMVMKTSRKVYDHGVRSGAGSLCPA